MNFMTFQSVGNFIIPTDALMFFRGVGIPPTRLLGNMVLDFAKISPEMKGYLL